MKDIEIDEIKKLLPIIKQAPLVRVGHFSDHGETLSSALSSFCIENDHDYILNCTDDEYFDKIQNKYIEMQKCRIKNFNLKRPNYMLQGKFYDYLFVSIDINTEGRESFLQKCHKVIKNAGLILIFVPHNDHILASSWKILLDENYYVATSTIDVGNTWDVIISKKMHGWGG